MRKLVITMMLLVCTKLWAQSLLANKSFDSDISSWDVSYANAVWISNDGASTSGNGSIEFGDTLNNGASKYIQSEFVNVKPNYHYILGTSYKLPTASLATSGNITIRWYDNNDNYLGEYPHYGVKPPFIPSAPDTWYNDISEWDNIVTDAVKAKVFLWVNLPSSGTGASRLRFDDVIFYQDTVFKSNFE